MSTENVTKSMDTLGAVALMSETLEFLYRMLMFYEETLYPTNSWLGRIDFTVKCRVEGTQPSGVRVLAAEEGAGVLQLGLFIGSTVHSRTSLQETKSDVLRILVNHIKRAFDSALFANWNSAFKTFTHAGCPQYVPGQAGKLYLVEVVNYYSSALKRITDAEDA